MSTQGSGLSTQMREQIDSDLQSFRSLTNTPAGLGWAIQEFVMANVAEHGTLNNGRLELQMVASISLPQPAIALPTGSTPVPPGSTDKVSEMTACHSICYTILGIQVYCTTECTHEVISHTHTVSR